MKIEFLMADGIGNFCQVVEPIPGEYAKVLRSMRASGLRLFRARLLR
jgi:hypothetical protein